MDTTIEFTRINNDTNGNPRYVCHFHAFITETDRAKPNHYNSDNYTLALHRAKRLGGRKFHNKQYGGGIVFQSYNIQELDKRIKDLTDNLIEVRFFLETGNGSEGFTPFAVWSAPDSTKEGFLMGYAHVGQHTEVHPDYLTDKKPARPKQYKDLKRELEGLGYYVEIE